MQVMLVEDDLDLGRALLAVLQGEGFLVEWVRRVADAWKGWDERFSGVLLDIHLSDGCGMDLLRRWRARGVRTPVLMITAKSDLESRLAGLNQGADDFLAKPFDPAEMVARLRAVLRRSAGQCHSVWRVGEMEVNPSSHSVVVAGQPVSLSPTEFELLLLLAMAQGAVVSKTRLLQAMAPRDAAPGTGSIDFHVFNLRRKLGASRIQTVRGVGYLLNP